MHNHGTSLREKNYYGAKKIMQIKTMSVQYNFWISRICKKVLLCEANCIANITAEKKM